MYGEELPVEEGLYDSDDFWRFNGTDYQVMDDERVREELAGRKRQAVCLRCSNLGVAVDECGGLGDGNACLLCARAGSECVWVGSVGGVGVVGDGEEVDVESSGEVGVQ